MMIKRIRQWATYIALASLLSLVATGCVKDGGAAAGGNAADATVPAAAAGMERGQSGALDRLPLPGVGRP